ncbi:MAG: PD-(D/E)XK motif protein [Erythrobacter sp.]|nr:PD-(D/E)XK motif protein [Erythrobacter sp.]
MNRQDLEGIWTVLSSNVPGAGVVTAPTGYRVMAGELLAGIDSDGRRHLLIPLNPGEAARTDTKGRAVHLARIAEGGTHYLTVFCLLPDLHRVFTQFCRELVQSIEQAPSPAREAAAAFDRWRALFSEAEHRGQLSDEALIGLMGELIAVERLLAHGAAPDLRFWVGPFGDLHDLRSATHAVEVKATLVREGRIVAISSIDQLQEPVGSDLVLLHIRFDRDPGGLNLPDLLTRTLAAGAHRPELERRLREVGVSLDDLTPYGPRRFRLTDTRAYNVCGPAFPRIVRADFAMGDLPPGTLRLSYSIDLTNEPPLPLRDDLVEAAFTSLAREVTP